MSNLVLIGSLAFYYMVAHEILKLVAGNLSAVVTVTVCQLVAMGHRGAHNLNSDRGRWRLKQVNHAAILACVWLYIHV